MRVYVDTEFTDFLNIDKISVALVCKDGRKFYAKHHDYRREDCLVGNPLCQRAMNKTYMRDSPPHHALTDAQTLRARHQVWNKTNQGTAR